MTTLNIPAEFVALQKIASKDAVTRPNISGVFFNCTYAVASDGHAMVRRKKAEGMPENEIHNLSLLPTRKDGGAVGESEPIDGQYPNIDPIWASAPVEGREGITTFRVNSALLLRALQAMSVKTSGRGESLIISVDGANVESAPIRIERTNDDAVEAIVMPMRSK